MTDTKDNVTAADWLYNPNPSPGPRRSPSASAFAVGFTEGRRAMLDALEKSGDLSLADASRVRAVLKRVEESEELAGAGGAA